MLIGFSEIYENTEILSPIDRQTWETIGNTARLGSESRVVELASGKGAFALYLAKKFGSKIDCFDCNRQFVEHAIRRANELGLSSHVSYSVQYVEHLVLRHDKYDLGVCLGSLYLFREKGWKVLTKNVKARGFFAVSDIFCKKSPPPREVSAIFFEEEEGPNTLDELREWYTSRGVAILREEECSRKAWLQYYDLMDQQLQTLARRYKSDPKRRFEIGEASKEASVFRKHGEEYIGYITFIMQKGI